MMTWKEFGKRKIEAAKQAAQKARVGRTFGWYTTNERSDRIWHLYTRRRSRVVLSLISRVEISGIWSQIKWSQNVQLMEQKLPLPATAMRHFHLGQPGYRLCTSTNGERGEWQLCKAIGQSQLLTRRPTCIQEELWDLRLMHYRYLKIDARQGTYKL